MQTTNFPALVADRLRSDAARPQVTFYDDATGERVELSLATYANWVNKTAGLLQDELEVERGGLLLVDLPTHWLGAVWLGAAWTMGLCVTADPELAEDADALVCGPAAVDRYAGLAERIPVLAVSLRPLGGRFTGPLPTGVTDFGAVVLAQPDVFVPYDEPAAADAAWRDAGSTLTQAELLAGADRNRLVEADGRLLTDLNPCTRTGLDTLVSPLLMRAGTVWVANGDERLWRRKYDEERATAQLRASALGRP